MPIFYVFAILGWCRKQTVQQRTQQGTTTPRAHQSPVKK